MPSSTRKPVVIVTRKLPDVVETRMCELFDTRLNVEDRPMSQAALIAAGKVAGKFGLFTIVPSGQDAPVLLRDLPGDSQVTDVGAVVGTLFDGIELQVNLQLLPSGSPRQVLVSGPPQVSYAIEATTDFANWVRVYTNPPATTGAYPEDFNAFRYRFYRGIPLSH